FLFLFAGVTGTGGKPLYLGGMFPVLFAAGAQPAIGWLRRGRPRLRAGLLTAAVVLTLTAIPVTLPVVPVTDVHRTPIVGLNYDAGETIGWAGHVGQVAAGDRDTHW